MCSARCSLELSHPGFVELLLAGGKTESPAFQTFPSFFFSAGICIGRCANVETVTAASEDG